MATGSTLDRTFEFTENSFQIPILQTFDSHWTNKATKTISIRRRSHVFIFDFEQVLFKRVHRALRIKQLLIQCLVSAKMTAGNLNLARATPRYQFTQRQRSHDIETSQLIWSTYQLTCFCMMGTQPILCHWSLFIPPENINSIINNQVT